MATELHPTFNKLLQEFMALDYTSRKNKVIELLELIEDKVDFAAWMLNFIKNTPDVSDDFLRSNYVVIIKSATKIADEEDNKLHDHLEDIASIKDSENNAQKQESQEADNLLHAI